MRKNLWVACILSCSFLPYANASSQYSDTPPPGGPQQGAGANRRGGQGAPPPRGH